MLILVTPSSSSWLRDPLLSLSNCFTYAINFASGKFVAFIATSPAACTSLGITGTYPKKIIKARHRPSILLKFSFIFSSNFFKFFIFYFCDWHILIIFQITPFFTFSAFNFISLLSHLVCYNLLKWYVRSYISLVISIIYIYI